MRVIKFRAWQPNKKRMLRMLPIQKLIVNVFLEEKIAENLVFQEYTGIKDVSGVEIFEGDIVERSLSGAMRTTTDEVYFNKGMFVIRKGEFCTPIANYYELKVIGNIYENPELLTQKE